MITDSFQVYTGIAAAANAMQGGAAWRNAAIANNVNYLFGPDVSNTVPAPLKRARALAAEVRARRLEMQVKRKTAGDR